PCAKSAPTKPSPACLGTASAKHGPFRRSAAVAGLCRGRASARRFFCVTPQPSFSPAYHRAFFGGSSFSLTRPIRIDGYKAQVNLRTAAASLPLFCCWASKFARERQFLSRVFARSGSYER